MIKAVLFDVDGTLLSHTSKSVPASTRDALVQLREAGIRVAVSTGRHLNEFERLPVGDLSFDAYIMVNGQMYLDEDRRLVWGNEIPEEAVKSLTRVFEEKQICLLFVEERNIYGNCVNEMVERAHEAISTPLPRIDSYTGNKLYQIVAYLPRGEEYRIEKDLAGCSYARWSDYGIDIFASSEGKVAGIRRFMAENGILPEELMAFGDGENDIGMLQLAGVGIAMGNAPDCVKAAADEVTDGVDDNGIANALRRHGLIR